MHDRPHLRQRADELLRRLYGASAVFREGQWDAIREVVAGRRVLVVQRTGWGKSLVYFLATRLLREQGSGPTILISPLLSLMRNQEDMAARLGVRARRLDSTNPDDWAPIEAELDADSVDLLMVSPERLANERFQTKTLPAIRRGIGSFVVDEAHCISDWGHDFRPDYRRIVRIVRTLPSTVPLLATTATANARVVADVRTQLGDDVVVIHGPLGRDTLLLQNISLGDQAERLAWLAEQLPALPGSGIVYCSTTRDCDRVSQWLALHGIDAPAYHADVEDRPALEARLLDNDVKALVATVALGMGFDKPDLGFVVHFQRPGSVVDYYQRIGRAGRAVEKAFVILLSGAEDEEISEYFIKAAFPSVEDTERVLRLLEEAEAGASLRDLQGQVNVRQGRLQQILKLLEIDGAVYREKGTYFLSGTPWVPDRERVARITAQRRHELERMRTFAVSQTCLMEFLTRELDDPESRPCGQCAVCASAFVPSDPEPALVKDAIGFLRRAYLTIEARKKWPTGKNIPRTLQAEGGRALCYSGDAGWGRLVRAGKYEQHRFGEELIRSSAEMISVWRHEHALTWVTAVPSLRRPTLVRDLASRLASALGLPFSEALAKTRETPEQKTMENSAHQAANVAGAFAAVEGCVLPGAVLLVDDLVDSRWTFTECAKVLREHGSGAVLLFALANSATTDGEG